MKVKPSRKVLSIFLSFAMVVFLFAGLPITASATEPDDCKLISKCEVEPGSYRIQEGGDYYIDSGVRSSSVITVATDEAVLILGDGVNSGDMFSDITIDCVEEYADLTIEDLYICNNVDSGSDENVVVAGSNIIRFTGSGNTLTLAGTSLLETVEYVASAGILVGAGTELTIVGDGTLYMYKYTQGSGIGGNSNMANGTIELAGGNIFIKGSKTGALIGNDTCDDPAAQREIGDISISGGNINLINKAQGAAVGGSRMSIAGDVYLEGGSLSIITDFSGSAIGAGARKKIPASNNGNLYITGGSLKTMITDNAYSSWGLVAGEPGEITAASGQKYYINDAAITAAKLYNGTTQVYRAVLDTTDISAVDGVYTVRIDTQPSFSTGLHGYEYYDTTTSTIPNWEPVTDNNLYLYLIGGVNHTVNVNGQEFDCVWDGTSGFTVTAV